jgi:hypothetical protein
MSPADFQDLLNEALSDLYGGWHFYIHSSIMVETPNGMLLRPIFEEMSGKNSGAIVSLAEVILHNGATPTTTINAWRNDLRSPQDILAYALGREHGLMERFSHLAANTSQPGAILPFINMCMKRTVDLKRSVEGI